MISLGFATLIKSGYHWRATGIIVTLFVLRNQHYTANIFIVKIASNQCFHSLTAVQCICPIHRENHYDKDLILLIYKEDDFKAKMLLILDTENPNTPNQWR